MPGADELPAEFQDPVAYSGPWLWVAIGLGVAVLAWYLLAWWLTRPRSGPAPAPAGDVVDVRAAHLAMIAEVEDDVRGGVVGARAGHQRLSDVVRGFVEAVTPLPARTMTLADFRAHAPGDLAAAIEVMYPPEFGPDDAVARERFDEAVARARAVVGRW